MQINHTGHNCLYYALLNQLIEFMMQKYCENDIFTNSAGTFSNASIDT